MNSTGLNPQLQDKVMFNKIMVKNNINTPSILASNDKDIFTFLGEDFNFLQLEEFILFLKELLIQSSSKSIFIKPIEGIGGGNSFKISKENIDDKELIENLFSLVMCGEYLFQETINQNKKIAEVYPNSINTVRVHTHFDKHTNQIKITSALMRFGSRGSVVDNGSLFVPVNHTDWTLYDAGKSFLKNGGKTFVRHPDTNFVFKGMKIPNGCEIEALVIKAAQLFSDPFIGWDVAITEDGVTLIEGNSNPHLIMTQIGCGGFKNDPIYKELFSELL